MSADTTSPGIRAFTLAGTAMNERFTNFDNATLQTVAWQHDVPHGWDSAGLGATPGRTFAVLTKSWEDTLECRPACAGVSLCYVHNWPPVQRRSASDGAICRGNV